MRITNIAYKFDRNAEYTEEPTRVEVSYTRSLQNPLIRESVSGTAYTTLDRINGLTYVRLQAVIETLRNEGAVWEPEIEEEEEEEEEPIDFDAIETELKQE